MKLPDRALTLWQPWAWLVVNGHKPIENRPEGFSYKSFRGEFWVHAGVRNKYLKDQWQRARELCDRYLGKEFHLPELDDLVYGRIIGRATAVDIIAPKWSLLHKPNVPWHFEGEYGFVLEKASEVAKPVECRGARGFWRVPELCLSELALQ